MHLMPLGDTAKQLTNLDFLGSHLQPPVAQGACGVWLFTAENCGKQLRRRRCAVLAAWMCRQAAMRLFSHVLDQTSAFSPRALW